MGYWLMILGASCVEKWCYLIYRVELPSELTSQEFNLYQWTVESLATEKGDEYVFVPLRNLALIRSTFGLAETFKDYYLFNTTTIITVVSVGK